MKKLNAEDFNPKQFRVLEPHPTKRLNRSVAWLVECKDCGKKQYAGGEQLKRGSQCRCVYCQILPELEQRMYKEEQQ